MAGIENTVLFSQGEKLQPSTSDDISRMQNNATDVGRINYTGNPEGNIAANPSSLCHDPSSGNVYIKSDGTGNTGWEQIGGELSAPPIGSLSFFSNANGDSYATAAGWLKCDGSIISQSTYSTLFSRMGLINGGGTVWTNRTSGTTSGIQSITFGNSLYVFGGNSGVLGSSTDAITWTAQNNGGTNPITTMAFGNSLYVSGGSNGVIFTSTDAVTWTQRLNANTNTIQTITYSGSLFVSGGNVGALSTSTDGVSWYTRNPSSWISTWKSYSGFWNRIFGFWRKWNACNFNRWSFMDSKK